MSDVRIRDEIAAQIQRHVWKSEAGKIVGDYDAANAILKIPAIKEALSFHESCQRAFEVNGEFVVTRENVTGKGGVSAS